MAKIRVMGDALQIKSTLKKTTVERAAKYCPDALKLFDEEKNEKFAIGLGNANISKYGVNFPNTDEEGYLIVTTENPVDSHVSVEVEKKFIQEEYATILAGLRAVEEKVAAVETELCNLEEKAAEEIEMV